MQLFTFCEYLVGKNILLNLDSEYLRSIRHKLKKKLFVNYYSHQQVLSENTNPFVRQGIFFTMKIMLYLVLGCKNGCKMFSLFQNMLFSMSYLIFSGLIYIQNRVQLLMQMFSWTCFYSAFFWIWICFFWKIVFEAQYWTVLQGPMLLSFAMET